ncbi:MAG: SDR family oxidoreductase [Alphaproteobacteria bacterium]|nr:SDR family oxidoreductase [Alphaproteobacteria bacterium]OJV16040.1 MAG: hypothetical protein BGO27_04255 [Alphaproteobacteria bacterium 33-17]
MKSIILPLIIGTVLSSCATNQSSLSSNTLQTISHSHQKEYSILQDLNVFVTGGSTGIGRETVIQYAKQGAKVAFTYNKNKEAADQVVKIANELGVKAIAIQSDFAKLDQKAAFELYDQVTKALGHINILVNNAGIVVLSDPLKITKDLVDQQLNINTWVPIYLMQAHIKSALNHNNTNHKKYFHRIVNVGSICSQIYTENVSLYEASKSTLLTFTNNFALQYAKNGIEIFTVSPGLTATEINRIQRENDPSAWKARTLKNPSRTAYEATHVAQEIVHSSTMVGLSATNRIVASGGQHYSHSYDYKLRK